MFPRKCKLIQVVLSWILNEDFKKNVIKELDLYILSNFFLKFFIQYLHFLPAIRVVILTLLNRDVSVVGCGDEAGLGQGVLQREELVLGHHVGARLEHCAGPDGGQVLAGVVAEGNVPAVVLHGEVALLQNETNINARH